RGGVRHDRVQPDEHQRRVRDGRSAAGDRVERAGEEADHEHDHDLAEVHPRRSLSAIAIAVAQSAFEDSLTARERISSTTVGSASVVVSPSSRFSATSRSSRRMIFPDRVFGSSWVNTMFAGLAIGPITLATWLRRVSMSSTEPSFPPFNVTNATMACPV